MNLRISYLWILIALAFLSCLEPQIQNSRLAVVQIAESTLYSEVTSSDENQSYTATQANFNGILTEQLGTRTNVSFQRVLGGIKPYKLFSDYTAALHNHRLLFNGFIKHRYTEPIYCIAFRQIII